MTETRPSPRRCSWRGSTPQLRATPRAPSLPPGVVRTRQLHTRLKRGSIGSTGLALGARPCVTQAQVRGRDAPAGWSDPRMRLSVKLRLLPPRCSIPAITNHDLKPTDNTRGTSSVLRPSILRPSMTERLSQKSSSIVLYICFGG